MTKRCFLDTVLFVLLANLGEHRINALRKVLFTRTHVKIDAAAFCEIRIHHPWINIDQLAEFLGNLIVGSEMIGLAPHRPTSM